MANTDKDVKIGIVTTADTRGANEATAAIDRLTGVERQRGMTQADLLSATEREIAEVDRLSAAALRLSAAREEEVRAMAAAEEAARREQAQLDVLEAKRRLAARGALAHSAAVANLGSVATQVGYQITDFTTQVSMGTNALVAFAQQAPQAIGAVQQFGHGMKLSLSSAVSWGTGVGLAVTEVAIGLQYLSQIWAQIEAEEKKAKDAAEQYRKDAILAKEAYANLLADERANFIADGFKRAADELARQRQELERIAELEAARGGAAAAAAQTAVTVAQNTGGDVTGAKANQIAVGVGNELAALNQRLAEGDAALRAANEAFDKANTEMQEAGRRYGQFSDQYKAADAKFEEARTALESAQADRSNLTAIVEAERQKILSGAQAAISDLSTGTTTALQQAAQQTLAAIQQKAATSGQELSYQARAGMETLQKVLADGVVKPEEITAITDAMNRVKSSREGADKLIIQGLDSLSSSVDSVLGTLPSLVSRIEQLESKSKQATGQ